MMTAKSYEIDLNGTDESAASVIRMLIDQLEGMRDTTPKPDELEWELRVYEYMLREPRSRLDLYQAARWDKNNRLISKRKTISNLGWVIP